MVVILSGLLRAVRNRLLQESDWTQLADSPLNAEKKASWATYRQTLRDLPTIQNIDNLTDFSQVNWPNQPD